MEYKELKEVCKINMGQSPDSSSYNDKKEGLPFYQGNADFGERYPITRVWCNAPTKIAQPEDILISVRAPIGALNYTKEECCIGRGLAAITPNKSKVSSEFVYWFLKGKNAELNSKGTGSTFKAINRKILEETMIPDLDFEKQHEYAQILEKTYDVIQQRKYELEQFDELIRSRFVELFSGTYKEIVAEDVCTQIIDCPHSTPKYDEENLIYPAIRTSEIQDGTISWESMKYVGAVEYEKRIKRLKPEKGDIVYAREGTYGDCVILPERHKFCLGQRTMLFRPDYRICTSAYLHAALRSDAVKRQADESNAGSTVPHVNVADAKRFHFPLPPLELQQQFADFVAQVDKSKVAVQKIFKISHFNGII